jgi:hypothetical protein
MDHQVFLDKILETENLTDNLEDKAANSLLKWGMAQVGKLIQGVEDEEAAGAKVNDLMHVMRGLNALAGNPADVTHEKIAELVNRYMALIGDVNVDEAEHRSIAERVSKMEPGEAINFLTEWLQTTKS